MRTIGQQRNVSGGSQVFRFKTAGIAAGATETVRIFDEFPAARLFEPLDQIRIINDSACELSIWFNTPNEQYSVPAYMIDKIADKPYRQFSIKNEDGAVAIAAGEVKVQCKKMGADIVLTKEV